MEPGPFDEKRGHPRYALCDNRFSVKLDLGSIGVLEVKIKDIGLGGIGLHLTTKELITGSEYHDRPVVLRFYERLKHQSEEHEILLIAG